MVKAARARDIHPSWAFAVTRQESAFMADARSHVGATGLMQLMPATARDTAKRFGIPLASPQQILNPNTNIQLGTAYLSQIYGQFNGNRVLASAAYNAGPGKVDEWLKNHGDPRRGEIDAASWIQKIPYQETRDYTRNILDDLQASAPLHDTEGRVLPGHPRWSQAAPLNRAGDPVALHGNTAVAGRHLSLAFAQPIRIESKEVLS